MRTRSAVYGLLGFVLGAGVLGAAIYWSVPKAMIVTKESPLGHEETVQAIRQAALDQGWKVPKLHRMSEGLQKFGHQVPPVTVIELCQPDYAAQVLKEDEGRMVAAMMPCRVSVYDTSDGKVMISRLNTGLVGKMYDGLIHDVMAHATSDTRTILSAALRPGTAPSVTCASC
jgi:uncharacterized protein (DUF302 family)